MLIKYHWQVYWIPCVDIHSSKETDALNGEACTETLCQLQ